MFIPSKSSVHPNKDINKVPACSKEEKNNVARTVFQVMQKKTL